MLKTREIVPQLVGRSRYMGLVQRAPGLQQLLHNPAHAMMEQIGETTAYALRDVIVPPHVIGETEHLEEALRSALRDVVFEPFLMVTAS